MNMLNCSAKEITNAKGKSENESGIQDESQKYENFIDSLFSIQKCHSNKNIMTLPIYILLKINLICSQIVSLNT